MGILYDRHRIETIYSDSLEKLSKKTTIDLGSFQPGTTKTISEAWRRIGDCTGVLMTEHQKLTHMLDGIHAQEKALKLPRADVKATHREYSDLRYHTVPKLKNQSYIAKDLPLIQLDGLIANSDQVYRSSIHYIEEAREKLHIARQKAKIEDIDVSLHKQDFQRAWPEPDPVYYENFKTRMPAKNLIFEYHLKLPLSNVLKVEFYCTVKCISAVEQRGLDQKAFTACLESLLRQTNYDFLLETDALTVDLLDEERDVHAIASLVKQFFRELPSLFFTFQPRKEQSILKYPMVVDNVDKNKMTSSNLSLLFGTVIFQGHQDGQSADHLTMSDLVLEDMITQTEFIFSANIPRPRRVDDDSNSPSITARLSSDSVQGSSTSFLRLKPASLHQSDTSLPGPVSTLGERNSTLSRSDLRLTKLFAGVFVDSSLSDDSEIDTTDIRFSAETGSKQSMVTGVTVKGTHDSSNAESSQGANSSIHSVVDGSIEIPNQLFPTVSNLDSVSTVMDEPALVAGTDSVRVAAISPSDSTHTTSPARTTTAPSSPARSITAFPSSPDDLCLDHLKSQRMNQLFYQRSTVSVMILKGKQGDLGEC
ncbi:hypothetical protein BSLG_005913 [Batrachochytrium salamandrivorans]|nr:hypothetical protein BSLG_005913 [Batrachochytrium salamandrivorans]